MHRLVAVTTSLALCALLACSSSTRAQFFRNNGVQLPNIGWMGLGSTWDAAAGGRLWNVNDQATLGLGYFSAIGYQMWWDNQIALGGSTTTIASSTGIEPVFSLNVSTGLRYAFLEERFRPFACAHIHYLNLLPAATAQVPVNPFLAAAGFVGLRVGGGVEWIFSDEMSLMFEAGAIGFVPASPPTAVPSGVPASARVNFISTPVLPASLARLSYQVYF